MKKVKDFLEFIVFVVIILAAIFLPLKYLCGISPHFVLGGYWIEQGTLVVPEKWNDLYGNKPFGLDTRLWDGNEIIITRYDGFDSLKGSKFDSCIIMRKNEMKVEMNQRIVKEKDITGINLKLNK
jgi:hypothetical protein